MSDKDPLSDFVCKGELSVLFRAEPLVRYGSECCEEVGEQFAQALV